MLEIKLDQIYIKFFFKIGLGHNDSLQVLFRNGGNKGKKEEKEGKEGERGEGRKRDGRMKKGRV